MAKPLVLQFGGVDIPFDMNKVERSDLYGFSEIEALDEKGRKCSNAVLADDGQSIIATGGTALVTLSQDGNWLEKSTLIPKDNQDNRLTPVPSSFASPVPLEKTASVDEYLSHDVRAIYQLSSTGDVAPLMAELKKGTIFQFPYSFRGGLEPDAGFLLLSADGMPFLAIGSPTKLEFVGLDQPAAVVEDEETGSEDEELDFSMM